MESVVVRTDRATAVPLTESNDLLNARYRFDEFVRSGSITPFLLYDFFVDLLADVTTRHSHHSYSLTDRFTCVMA